ncbi:hypothetical protein ACFHVG_28465, partial [Micromonospora sp. LOL_027]
RPLVRVGVDRHRRPPPLPARNKDTAAAWQATEELATLQQAHTDLADDLAAYEANLGRAAASGASEPADQPAPKKQRRNPKA